MNLSTRSVKARRVCAVVVAAGLLLLLWAAVRGSFVPVPSGPSAPDTSDALGDKLKPFRITPEYDRKMEKVVISLAKRDVSLRYQHEILLRLPEYTKVILLVPEGNLELIKADLGSRPYRDSVQMVPYDPRPRNDTHFYLVFPEKTKLIQVGADQRNVSYTAGSLWARDLFMVAKKPDGKTLLLISDVHKWFNSSDDKSPLKVISDNSYLGNLSGVGMDVQRIPVTFDGGNIVVDEFGDQRVVICGGDVLRSTRTVWKSTRRRTPTNSRIVSMLKEFLGADKVVVIGSAQVQPSLMFHLDQAMTLLPNRTVGITHVVRKGPEEAANAAEVKKVIQFLSELRSTLLRLGYTLVDIDTSTHNIVNYQYYVNGIQYVDARTRQRTYLMPVFPSSQTQFEEKLVKKNAAAFESLGYNVVHIPTKADNIHGGIHCLANVVE